ncbi:hypothetical protein DDW11_01880 [Sulfolobus sp. SCGC AB-777_G06]|jgi:transposase-like protein|nr:hypothetical protein DDW11_01880 [Sulfolobus sp. SCGC AB-777_G06]
MKKYNVEIVVTDGVESLDRAINSSQMKIKRRYCIVHMKYNMTKGEREELDKLIKSTEEGETMSGKYGVLNCLETPR